MGLFKISLDFTCGSKASLDNESKLYNSITLLPIQLQNHSTAQHSRAVALIGPETRVLFGQTKHTSWICLPTTHYFNWGAVTMYLHSVEDIKIYLSKTKTYEKVRGVKAVWQSIDKQQTCVQCFSSFFNSREWSASVLPLWKSASAYWPIKTNTWERTKLVSANHLRDRSASSQGPVLVRGPEVEKHLEGESRQSISSLRPEY